MYQSSWLVVSDLASKIQYLDDWYQTSLGQQVFSTSRELVEQWVSDICPDFLLQVGCHSFYQKACHAKQTFVHVDPRTNSRTNGLDVCCGLEHLPFMSDIFPMAICPHIHEMMVDHSVIFKELYRVLEPEGYLILVGVNMKSCWGVEYVMGRHVSFGWSEGVYSSATVMSNLSRIGFELRDYQTVFFSPFSFGLPRVLSQLMDSLGSRYFSHRGAIEIMILQKKRPGLMLNTDLEVVGASALDV